MVEQERLREAVRRCLNREGMSHVLMGEGHSREGKSRANALRRD